MDINKFKQSLTLSVSNYNNLIKLSEKLRGMNSKRWHYLTDVLMYLGIEPLRIAEIGVHEGLFSEKIHEAFPNAELHLIDPWAVFDDYDENYWAFSNCKKKADDMYKDVVNKFKLNTNVKIIRKRSEDYVKDVEDNYFDLVFIDGNHQYEFVKQDIMLWYPKVKKGGLLAGHDYKRKEGVKKAVNELLVKTIISGSNKGDVWVFPKG